MKISVIALLLLSVVSVEAIQKLNVAKITKAQQSIWDKDIDEAMKIAEQARADANG